MWFCKFNEKCFSNEPYLNGKVKVFNRKRYLKKPCGFIKAQKCLNQELFEIDTAINNNALKKAPIACSRHKNFKLVKVNSTLSDDTKLDNKVKDLSLDKKDVDSSIKENYLEHGSSYDESSLNECGETQSFQKDSDTSSSDYDRIDINFDQSDNEFNESNMWGSSSKICSTFSCDE